ncbi:2,3-bisphosphoglycerate-independent phosphoglycerate mutase [bacterium]|jgi:2,3-bisphosphoglycerate-independent phosphoglycerate mutase|nr:2,3-bisphosphoglycerate-independent phosphoglycerate mutase [bacterium]
MSNLQLDQHDFFPQRPGPVVLIIMDGVGIGPDTDANGVYLANTPYLDTFPTTPLYTQLRAHGTAVGMPSDDDMGNSEVGHNALGAGRVFEQGATLVKTAIESGEMFAGEVWKKIIDRSVSTGGTLHLMGLLSDGNVHSHIDQWITVLERAAKAGVKTVRLHTLLDGRDVVGRSALGYLETVQTTLDEINRTGKDYRVASGGGRMITTMDRYNADWTIVERGWSAHVLGEADVQSKSAEEAIQQYYDSSDGNDQYIPPFVVTENDRPVGTIEDGDNVILMNFRGDRAMEITQAFESGDEFDRFDRKRVPNVFFAGLMEYDGDLHIPNNYLVNPPTIERPISEYLCAEGVQSFAISETQKYGHVTYFWNGNKSGKVDEELETYVEIPSDKVPFEQLPKMKAVEITDKAIEMLKSGQYDFGRINYPNGDMVGHTGDMAAVIESVEITDVSVKRIVDCVSALQGVTIILADHGNADEMYTEKKGVKTPKTSHTLNPVPCAIIDPLYNDDYDMALIQDPGLANVAATICNLLGYEAPADYEPSLIEKR